MGIKTEIFEVFDLYHNNPSYRDMAKITGIEATRVFRLRSNNASMRLSELCAILKTLPASFRADVINRLLDYCDKKV